jgi:hypothetical protein
MRCKYQLSGCDADTGMNRRVNDTLYHRLTERPSYGGSNVEYECPQVAIYFLIRALDDRIFLFRCSRKAFRYEACDHIIQELRSAIRINDAQACECADEID